MEYLKLGVDYGILGVLGAMSVLSVGLFIERLFFFASVKASLYPTIQKYENTLTRHLTTIGTIASNAPYVGLLGTVLAIMLTFMTMSESKIDPGAIMTSLALALKATAAGLVVAIVAMIGYNILARIVETKLAHYNEEI